MRIAHLILAHKNPKQLEKLINALQHPHFSFFIHIDKKADQSQFEFLSAKPNVFFIKNRTKIYWAGFGTIQATINGFKEILPENFDYINVISAQDFPIKSVDFIYKYFEENNGKEFITCESIDGEWNVAPRVRNYHFINWRIPGKFRLEKIANKILPKRKFPIKNFELVGRANWFTLSNNAIKYSLDFLNKNPSVIHYFKYCWGADEFIFSSILYNNSSFKKKIVDNVVYVTWEQKAGHPNLITVKDFEALKKSNKLFARKFDLDKDSEIFSLLEEFLKQ